MSQAVITFDFDAISLWVVRGMTTPGPVSRGEFGAYAIPRILDSLARHDIRATFFIPGHTVETYPAECTAIRDAGHEIALHGYMHELVSDLTPAQEAASVDKALEVFASVLDISPVGIRTPAWDFTHSTIEIIEQRGLLYDSSLMGRDYEPYWVRRDDRCPVDSAFEFGMETDIVELPVSWTLDDYPQVEYLKSAAGVQPGPKTAAQMFEQFFDDFRYMERINPQGFHMVTMHPQVTGRGQRMIHFEDYLDRLVAAGAEFTTCADVAAGFRQDSTGV